MQKVMNSDQENKRIIYIGMKAKQTDEQQTKDKVSEMMKQTSTKLSFENHKEHEHKSPKKELGSVQKQVVNLLHLEEDHKSPDQKRNERFAQYNH